MEYAQSDAADESAKRVSQTPDNRRDETADGKWNADMECRVLRRCDQYSAERAERGAQDEPGRNHPFDLDSENARDLGIDGAGAHGSSEFRAAVEQAEQKNEQERDADDPQDLQPDGDAEELQRRSGREVGD